MSYEWVHDFVDGNTRMVCSICGVPYRFPSEIRRSADGLFRCLRTCDEQTILERDRKIAASHGQREAPPIKFGLPPPQDTAQPNTASLVGGAADVMTNTVTVPAMFFDDNSVGRTLTLFVQDGDLLNGSYPVTKFVAMHVVGVSGLPGSENFIMGTATLS